MTPERHAQIKEVFLAACARPEEERPAFLDQACGDDDDLRGQVDLLLAHNMPDPSVSGPRGSEETVGEHTRENSASSGITSPPLPPAGAEGGFQPGQRVADRYRIVALLGKGGMGAVYRADDLKLGQSVALKFLAAEHAKDPSWLGRFRQEVRLAREVTHPNVCRVYDIGEADGVAFISMEYVDGEDLKTLLKRIGRLPGDKAIDIARQLCAGLAAAHVRGVLHRDLKPANIMLDGRGKVRITDFGLAGLVGHITGMEIQAGTPRYMAPEQLAGKEVSERSDLYSLGLVLYELFTGKAAFSADDFVGYYHLHQESDPSHPSSIVSDIDPDAEAIILACLRKDPKARPESALAVAAALPGGDLLAAALAAGETPSPEMVAAAGARVQVRQSFLWACLVGMVALLCAVVALVGRTHWVPTAELENAPEVLAAEVRKVLFDLGYHERPVDYSYGFSTDLGFHAGVTREDTPSSRPMRLAASGEVPLMFWHRRSNAYLVPFGAANVLFSNAQVSLTDPPANMPGMVTTVLDAQGRLLLFEAVTDGRRDAAEPRQAADWSVLLDHAGLGDARLEQTEPTVLPRSYADTRAAWVGARTEGGDDRIRVEAAACDGRPVLFAVLDCSDPTAGAPATRAEFRRRVSSVARQLLLVVAILAAGPLAWNNVRAGRSHRRGALRVAELIVSLRMIVWLLIARHVPDFVGEMHLIAYAILGAMGEGVLVWAFYVALEPYVRRFWPQTIVSWSRLLAGHLRDPLVGRDILLGGVVGTLWILIIRLDSLAPSWLGLTARGQLRPPDLLLPLLSARYGVAECFDALRHGIYQGVFLLLLVALLRGLFRRPWLAAVAAVVVIAPMYAPLGSHPAISWLAIGGGCVTLAVWALMRFGLVTIVVAFLTSGLLLAFPVTFDMRAWYADISLFALFVVAGLGMYGFLTARKGRPLVLNRFA